MIVCGIRDIRIQHGLLAKPKLSPKRAVDLALAINAVDKDASEIQKGNSQEGNTLHNKVDTKFAKVSILKCNCCGGKRFTRNSHLKDAKCYA